MHSGKLAYPWSALLIAALACTLGQAPPGAPNAAPTATGQAPAPQVQTDTPGPPTATPQPTLTGTPTVPQVSVSAATNCRTGPSTAYALLWTMQPLQVAEVVGKNTETGYWIIKYPSGQCWLWGQYASVTGNVAALPEFAQPPTPTPSKPSAPSNVKLDWSCSPIPATLTFAVHVTFSWTDNASNEEGYHIFRNGGLVATLGANSSSFVDDTTLPVAPAIWPPQPGPKITYGVEAFNGDETSALKERELNCD